MTATIIDAGAFNRQLSVENQVSVPDGCGGFTSSYSVDSSLWAHLVPQKANVKVIGRANSVETTHKIMMRFRSGIKPGTRLVTGSRRFEVMTVIDPDETRKYLQCQAVEL